MGLVFTYLFNKMYLYQYEMKPRGIILDLGDHTVKAVPFNHFLMYFIRFQWKDLKKTWKKQQLYDPFLLVEFNCLNGAELLCRDNLLFTTKFPEVSGIFDQSQKNERLSQLWSHADSGFEHRILGLGI